MKRLQDFLQEEKNSWKRHDNGQFDTFDFLQLVKVWPQIVGEDFADKTMPLSLKNDTLILGTTHGIFAEHLHLVAEELKSKIFKFFPQLRNTLKQIRTQRRPELFKVAKTMSQHIQEQIDNPNRISLHAQSPEYKKARALAEIEFKDLEDLELKELFISLFIQCHNP